MALSGTAAGLVEDEVDVVGVVEIGFRPLLDVALVGVVAPEAAVVDDALEVLGSEPTPRPNAELVDDELAVGSEVGTTPLVPLEPEHRPWHTGEVEPVVVELDVADPEGSVVPVVVVPVVVVPVVVVPVVVVPVVVVSVGSGVVAAVVVVVSVVVVPVVVVSVGSGVVTVCVVVVVAGVVVGVVTVEVVVVAAGVVVAVVVAVEVGVVVGVETVSASTSCWAVRWASAALARRASRSWRA